MRNEVDVEKHKVETSKLKLEIEQLRNKLKTFTEMQVVKQNCQTDEHSEIPYKVTDQLPPIFSSQLCHQSRPIYLSNSVPKLESICWSKPSEHFIDEAEEALGEQYDRQVKEYYIDAKDRARAAHEQHHLPSGPGPGDMIYTHTIDSTQTN